MTILNRFFEVLPFSGVAWQGFGGYLGASLSGVPMVVEELIEILHTYPNDIQIFIQNPYGGLAELEGFAMRGIAFDVHKSGASGPHDYVQENQETDCVGLVFYN